MCLKVLVVAWCRRDGQLELGPVVAVDGRHLLINMPVAKVYSGKQRPLGEHWHRKEREDGDAAGHIFTPF